MKIKKTIFTAAILMAAVCLPAQNKSAGINISIWKDICTQPHDSTQTTYVNIGLLSTMNRLNGVGINALGSVVHGDMNGVQITGLANLAGGTMRGVQLAGISNISGNNTVGLSAAGLVNITGDRTQGVIISGLTSIGGDNTSGLMISGFMNVTGNMASGLHFSGAANITGQSFGGLMASGLLNVVGEHMNGLQMAGIANITASKLNGVQIALCNYATQARGLQIGLVNYYKEDMKGFQLGLVNANPDTRVQMMVYGGNATPANIGVRFKNQLFYTILGIGSMYQNGLQMAGIANITASKLNGVQIALCNYATQARGLQIGLVNYYKEDMKGFQLGLVNANPDTRVQMMVYGGNATPANIGVRFKNQLFYTILGIGSMYQGLNDKFSASASYRAGLSFTLYKGLSISGDLGYQHIEAFDNKDEVIPKRLYALQARANLEYQITRKFGIYATGGYGLTRFYNKSSNYDKGAIIEAGIVLF